MGSADEKHQIGFWMTWALVAGTMIGAGIFMLPVSLAPYGANAIVGWIVSGVGAVSLAYALGRLARHGGQGIQAYIEHSFGPFVAFLATFLFWVSTPTSIAAVAVAAGAATVRMAPSLAGETAVALIAIGFIAFLTLTNALGARSTGRLAVVTTFIKILLLASVILVLFQVSASGKPLAPLAALPLTIDNIAGATALTLYALLGFETAVAPVGKVRDPERTIPRALIGGTGFVGVLYLVTSTAILLLLTVEVAVISNSPFADAIARSWGEYGALVAALGIAISGFGYINGSILVAGELGYSMALRRHFPAILARTIHRNTPVNAQLLGSAIAIGLLISNMSKGAGDLFTFMALLTTSATLWLYLVAALAALKQRPTGLGLLAVIVALLFVLFAFYGSGLEANLWSLALLAAGTLLYAFMRWRGGSSRGAAADPVAPPESVA